MKKYILIFFIFSIIVSCDENKRKDIEKSNKVNKNLIISKNNIPDSLFSNILVIKTKCAVVYEPTEKNIEKSKKDIGEEKFYIGADDFLFYMYESNEFLESKKVKIVKTENNKILKFISNNKQITIIKLDLEKEIWGVYLFDPKQAPKKISIMAISDEFDSYMK